MQKPLSIPFYIHSSQIILGLIGLFYILYVGQHIILPIIFATILAILLNPVVNFLYRKKFNRLLAISIVIVLAIIVFGSLIYFISSQVSMFSDSLPLLKKKVNSLLSEGVKWISVNFNVSVPRIEAWLNETKQDGIGGTEMIRQTIGTIGDVLAFIVLLPVYVFMLLFYKPMLLEFFAMIFPNQKKSVNEILAESKTLIQHYLVGLMIEALIVATLISTGLLLMGIDYAVLLGLMSAMFNLIPYIGNILATILPIAVTLTTKPPLYILLVLGLYVVVQFIDNNLIVPKIVASKVEINALISIIIVIIGGTLWGVPGMFLAIPLTAIVKVIFDRIEVLKPIGYLLGENMPEEKRVVKHTKPIKHA